MADLPAASPSHRAHAGTLRQFARFAADTGLDLAACLPPPLLAGVRRAEADDMVPAALVPDVLQAAAQACDRADLGIAFAVWSDLEGYGPVSRMWPHCASLADLIRISGRYLRLENEALGTRVEIGAEEVALVHFTATPAPLGSSQFIEATLALDVRLARTMFGLGWAPLRLELMHRRPPGSRRHAGFGCPIEHGALRNALVIARADLTRPRPGADAAALARVEAEVAALSAALPAELPKQVELLIGAHLAGGGAGLDRIAALMAMSRRTLQRRLASEGLRFPALVGRVRRRVAADYFASEASPNLGDLAWRLGFAGPAVTARFVRATLGPVWALKRGRAVA